MAEDVMRSSGVKQSLGADSNCATCGKGGDGRMLHRLKHLGSITQLCSSCVLFYNRCMYCSLCYQVSVDPCDLGDPALWVTCSKCLSLSHLHCHNQTSNSSSICHRCCCSDSSSSKRPHGIGNDSVADLPELKKLRVSEELSLDAQDHPFIDQETLTATQLVAIKARKDAESAKAKVVALAEVSATALARAKVAIDNVFHAQREEGRMKSQLVKHLVSGNGSVQGGVESEKVDVQMVGNNHVGQVAPTVAPVQQNEILMDIPNLHSSFSCEAKETDLPFNEVTIQDYLLAIHDMDDQIQNSEVVIDIITLPSSEGLLTNSSHLDIMQEPHHSCTSRTEGHFPGSISQGFVEACTVEESDAFICEMTSSLHAFCSHCQNHEFHTGAFISGQATSDPGKRETLLHEIDLADRGLLECNLLQDNDVLNTDIFSSDVTLCATSAAINRETEVKNDASKVAASNFPSTEQDLCPQTPIQHDSFSPNFMTVLEELNNSVVIQTEDQIRNEPNTAVVADSVLNWANHEAKLQHGVLFDNSPEQAAKSIINNLNNVPIELGCSMAAGYV